MQCARHLCLTVSDCGVPAGSFWVVRWYLSRLTWRIPLRLPPRPIKNTAAWKPVLGRLRLLETLLPALGVAGGGGSGGFQPDALMAFVGAALGSANEQVARCQFCHCPCRTGTLGMAVRCDAT